MRSLGRKGGGRGLPLIASVTLGLLPSPYETGSEQQRPSMVGARAARVSRRDDTLRDGCRYENMQHAGKQEAGHWSSGWGQARASWGMGHRGTG